MSAAEDLAALYDIMSNADPGVSWEDNARHSFMATLKMRSVLPQIAEVVEAAESVTSADEGAWHGSRLLLSLSALEEALS